MNTNKVLYWGVLGVFALGLRSEYQSGRLPAMQGLADRAESTVCRLVSRAEQTVALARVLTTPQPFAAGDLLASTRDREWAQAERVRDQARAHAELLRERVQAQSELIRAQAELQRSQIEQIRWRTQSQLRFTNAARRRVMLICPKTGARISVNAGPTDVAVGANF